MGLIHEQTSHRAVWSLLRRTRQKFQILAREQPLFAERIGRVVETIASEEAALIAEDPRLPFRRGRGPRPVAKGDGLTAVLTTRIEELERAVRAREEHLAIVSHELRSRLSPVMLLVQRLLDDVTGKDGPSFFARAMRPRLETISHRLAQLVDSLNDLLDSTRFPVDDVARPTIRTLLPR